MFDYERQATIMNMLHARQRVTTDEIAKALFISEATARRDLKQLETAGLIRRTHGGAVLISGPLCEIPLELREAANSMAKQRIAAKAVTMIRDGFTVLLDASSTVSVLIPLLGSFQGLTVITNSPKAAVSLAAMHIKVLCTGGLLLDNSLAFVGRHAERLIESINADIAFLSCRGISEDNGATDSSLEEAEIRRAMLARAGKRVLMCDKSKFGKNYTYTIAQLEQFDSILTD